MLKKSFIFIISLFLGYSSMLASVVPEAPSFVDEKVGQQYEAYPHDSQSREVDYIEESELAHKIQQAQKAQDAQKYDSFGGGITIIAMCIVIGALIVLSILFMLFGKISSWFISRKKQQLNPKLGPLSELKPDASPDSGEVIAAISAALAQHFATDHDMQDTILTIRRMRKAYSPWNSKIYNMRHLPEVVHNHPKKM